VPGLDDRVHAWGASKTPAAVADGSVGGGSGTGKQASLPSESKLASIAEYEKATGMRQILSPDQKRRLDLIRMRRIWKALFAYPAQMKIKEKNVALRRKAAIFQRRWLDVYRQKEWIHDTSIEVSRLFVKRYLRRWRACLAKKKYLTKVVLASEKGFARLAFLRLKSHSKPELREDSIPSVRNIAPEPLNVPALQPVGREFRKSAMYEESPRMVLPSVLPVSRALIRNKKEELVLSSDEEEAEPEVVEAVRAATDGAKAEEPVDLGTAEKKAKPVDTETASPPQTVKKADDPKIHREHHATMQPPKLKESLVKPVAEGTAPRKVTIVESEIREVSDLEESSPAPGEAPPMDATIASKAVTVPEAPRDRAGTRGTLYNRAVEEPGKLPAKNQSEPPAEENSVIEAPAAAESPREEIGSHLPVRPVTETPEKLPKPEKETPVSVKQIRAADKAVAQNPMGMGMGAGFGGGLRNNKKE
jgi:hypothetical protein